MLTRITMFAVLACAACDDNMGPLGAPDAATTNSDAGTDANPTVDLRRSYIYLETNDPGGNAIAVLDRGFDGSIIAGKRRYSTGGVGITAGPMHQRGPLDSTGSLAISQDHGTLYAANTGGSTVATFRTHLDGSLEPVGSPSTVGANPASLALVFRTMYVVNKVVDGSSAPTLATMTIGENGELVPTAEMKLQVGGSPSIAYLTPDAKFLFVTEFFDGNRRAPSRQLDAYARLEDGTLVPLPGQPFATPVALGVIAHPASQTLYVGFPLRGDLGVYTYSAGGIRFVRLVTGDDATVFAITRDGSTLYALGSKLSIYSVHEPDAPRLLGAIDLGCRGRHADFDAAQQHLYVSCDDSVHVVSIDPHGRAEEKYLPVDLRAIGIPERATPQGLVVFEPALR